jgi:hypothetical protein
MKLNLKHIRLLFIASCFFYLSCQPDGGDLMPIKLNEGRIVSTQYKNNTAYQYDTDRFSIKASGKWESLRGGLDFVVVVKNRCKCEIAIDFNKVILSTSLYTEGQVGVVQADDLPVLNRLIKNKVGTVNENTTRIFRFGGYDSNQNSKTNVKYRGNEVLITIPITIKDSRVITTTNHDFRFKYDSYQPEADLGGNLID